MHINRAWPMENTKERLTITIIIYFLINACTHFYVNYTVVEISLALKDQSNVLVKYLF